MLVRFLSICTIRAYFGVVTSDAPRGFSSDSHAPRSTLPGRSSDIPDVQSSSPVSSHWFFARLAVVAAAVFLVSAPIGAGATPPDAAPTTESLEVAAEHYNLARLKVDRATAALDATDRRIAAAQAHVAAVRTRTRARAAALYRGTTINAPISLGRTGQLADAHRRSAYLDAAERPDRNLLDTLRSELDHLAAERAGQRDVRDLLRRNVAEAAQAKRQLQSLAAEAAARGVTATDDGAGPLATSPPPAPGLAPSLVPSPAPSTRGTASATTTTTSTTVVRQPVPTTTTPATSPTPRPTPTPPGNEPAVSSGAATAVAFARAQLGKPYVFATSGPNTFDCSGLTMAAWAAAGVRMPHYSGSQATIFPRLAWQQLKPGDLVFFYNDLHHVGLYIGGGMMIHAPHTGDVVRIAPAWRDTFMWGVRPH